MFSATSTGETLSMQGIERKRQLRTLAPVSVSDRSGKPLADATIGRCSLSCAKPISAWRPKCAPGMYDATAYFVEQLGQPKKTFEVSMTP